ncbi:MAG: DedA family protein [Ignavibacteria bacterium]|nr:MAG: DedA family protein [Ignavibacteria bacterium]KAF0161522.1 MAG: DedA family protein [Ignavibacteria bacterium]
MLQDILAYISALDPAVIYLVLFFFAFIENIFPPSPSDVVLVIGSTLITNTPIGFIPILAVTSIGSAVGFIVMYFIGEFLGEKLIRKGKFKFLKKESLDKTDEWFSKYGYKLILINRFIPGTRAVISFFCGVHRLKPAKTFFYAALSSFVWNALLISLGAFLGNNIEMIDKYLGTYSNIVLGITAIVIAFALYKFWIKKKSKQ